MIAYPRTDILDLCKVRTAKFWPLWRQELSRSAGAQTQAKDLGSPLWRASFATAPAHFRDAAAIEAALISLNGSAGSFLGHDVRRPFPAAYADGVFDDTAVIDELDTGDAFRIRLGGLPQGFTLTPGDYLGFSYGSRPSRALHTVTVGGAAGSQGKVWLTVFPWIRAGAAAGTPVTLKRPPCEMILEGGGDGPAMHEMVASSISFSAMQIL